MGTVVRLQWPTEEEYIMIWIIRASEVIICVISLREAPLRAASLVEWGTAYHPINNIHTIFINNNHGSQTYHDILINLSIWKKKKYSPSWNVMDINLILLPPDLRWELVQLWVCFRPLSQGQPAWTRMSGRCSSGQQGPGSRGDPPNPHQAPSWTVTNCRYRSPDAGWGILIFLRKKLNQLISKQTHVLHELLIPRRVYVYL